MNLIKRYTFKIEVNMGYLFIIVTRANYFFDNIKVLSSSLRKVKTHCNLRNHCFFSRCKIRFESIAVFSEEYLYNYLINLHRLYRLFIIFYALFEYTYVIQNACRCDINNAVITTGTSKMSRNLDSSLQLKCSII